MTYIFDMAGGTEYLGDESQHTQPSAAPGPEAAAYDDRRVELRLAEVETQSFEQRQHDLSQGIDLSALIKALED